MGGKGRKKGSLWLSGTIWRCVPFSRVSCRDFQNDLQTVSAAFSAIYFHTEDIASYMDLLPNPVLNSTISLENHIDISGLVADYVIRFFVQVFNFVLFI